MLAAQLICWRSTLHTNPGHSWLSLLAVFGLFQLALGANITIDDTNGDPTNGNKVTYEPAGAWVSGGCGSDQSCVPPNADAANAGTYTGSFIRSPQTNVNANRSTASVTFTGTSVSVICIVADSNYGSELVFYIDGDGAGTYYHHAPPRNDSPLVNLNVFQSKPLPLQEHTLLIKNGFLNSTGSLVILDSIIYSDGQLDNSGVVTSTPSSPNPATSQVATSSSPSAGTVTSSATRSGSVQPDSEGNSGVVTSTPSSPNPTTSQAAASSSLSAATVASSASTSSGLGKSSNSNTAPIIGAVVGALVVILFGLALLYIRRRRNQRPGTIQISTFPASIEQMAQPEKNRAAAHDDTSRSSQVSSLANPAVRPSSGPRPGEEHHLELASGVQDQLQSAMRQIEVQDARIHELELQQRSLFAMGMSDELPPVYGSG
ncbi:hypothetical protein GGX14DRAFT_644793 [Mycena pura]|uniref:Uncharacterized protein n=1 Tax=Mycena pura TaxID=153505 RepID=A0AAD6YEI5_9AGAR|nr:hypothetical protein GGX14DRAFT_644793 [Mycena pura]